MTDAEKLQVLTEALQRAQMALLGRLNRVDIEDAALAACHAALIETRDGYAKACREREFAAGVPLTAYTVHDDLVEALLKSLCYIEDMAAIDTHYSPGAVAKQLKTMRAALRRAGAIE